MQKKIETNRINHMHGVAEYMYQNASKYGLLPSEMYVLGLIHDIGYLSGKENHEEYGSMLLFGYIYDQEIAWHGSTPTEYKNFHQCDDNAIPKALHLLWEADMHIDSKGKEVSFEERLADIGKRYGIDSKAYCICKEIIDWLYTQIVKENQISI